MRVALAIPLFLPLVLTGCSLTSTAPPTAVTGLSIRGNVHGGQQPVVGSHVYLLAANTTGYGATHVSSSGTALAQVGIANAFANAGNLANLATGVALAITPGAKIIGNHPQTVVPQPEINTLANILASCVNSTGAITGPVNPTTCYTLFNNATVDGTATGMVPSDTAMAAINIAHNPGVNTAVRYGLQTANPTFAPALATKPNDFTISISFEGGANGYGGLYSPQWIATDGSGSAWVTNQTGSTVTKLLSSGAVAAGSPFTNGSSVAPNGIAVDTTGSVWVAYENPGTVSKFLNTGSAAPGSPFTQTGLSGAYGIAIDGFGDAWVTTYPNSVSKLLSTGLMAPGFPVTGGGLRSTDGIAIDGSEDAWVVNHYTSVSKLLNTGTEVAGAPYTGNGVSYANGVAIDSSGNAWIANADAGGSVSKFSNTGVAATGSPFTGGGISDPQAVAIDGSGNVWVTSTGLGVNTISEISNLGNPISPSTGYTGAGVNGPLGIAIDGSGDVWVANTSDGVAEFIGAATPVVTPLAAGVANNTLGTRP